MTDSSPAAATTTNAAAADATSGTPGQTTLTTPNATATPAPPATPAVPPGDAKPADAAPAANAGETPPPETPQGAPEKYAFTAPEGFTLEPETTTQFESVARELNLTNDQANKLVPLAAELVAKNVALQQEAHTKQVQKWAEDAKADKELGGDKFEQTVTVAKKAMDRFGSPELRQLMDQTGLGNNPEVIRLFHRIGSAIADDSFVNAPSGNAGKPPLAARMYPNMTK